MKPLLVLLSSFVIALFMVKIVKREYDVALSARIGMAIMLCFTALGHFLFTKGMAMMVPPFIPFKTTLVHITGIFEVLLAMGLLIPKFQRISGWALLIFLILMLPANIYAAIHHINYQKGTFDGNGSSYLWFRIPLQLLFMVWTYLSAIRMP